MLQAALFLIIGIVIGFFVGGWVILSDVKSQVKKGFAPYLDTDGTLQWREM